MKGLRIFIYTIAFFVMVSVYCGLPLALAVRSMAHPMVGACLAITGGILLVAVFVVSVILRRTLPNKVDSSHRVEVVYAVSDD